MQIQPVTYQPKFNGKIIFADKGTNKVSTYVTEELGYKLNRVKDLIKDKPYDVFLLNDSMPDFIQVAVGDSFEHAISRKSGKFFVHKSVIKLLNESLTDIISYFEENLSGKDSNIIKSAKTKDYNLVAWNG